MSFTDTCTECGDEFELEQVCGECDEDDNPWKPASEKPKEGAYLVRYKMPCKYDGKDIYSEVVEYDPIDGWEDKQEIIFSWMPIPDGWQEFVEKTND